MMTLFAALALVLVTIPVVGVVVAASMLGVPMRHGSIYETVQVEVSLTNKSMLCQPFGFVRLPEKTQFGILPKGTLLSSPCEGPARFFLQLIEPPAVTPAYDEQEAYQRVAFGTADVPSAVDLLRKRGLEFVETAGVKVTENGAITRNLMHSVVFELVRHKPS